MAVRYHVNPGTGEAGLCRAFLSCPFGDLVTDHFATPEEARVIYEHRTKSRILPASVRFENYVSENITQDSIGFADRKELDSTSEPQGTTSQEIELSLQSSRGIYDSHTHLKYETLKIMNFQKELFDSCLASGDKQTMESIAANPNLSYGQFKTLSSAQFESVKIAIASNMNTPMMVLKRMLRRISEEKVQFAISSRADLAAEFLDKILRGSINISARAGAAANPNLNEASLNYASQHFEEFIRKHAAMNINNSEHNLWKLSKDSLAGIRIEVASNPRTTSFMLESLSRDKDHGVVLAIMNNMATPLHVLEKFVLVSDDEIRRAAKNTSKQKKETELGNTRVFSSFR